MIEVKVDLCRYKKSFVGIGILVWVQVDLCRYRKTCVGIGRLD